MPLQTKRILLLMHTWAGYLQGIQQGIAQYLMQKPDWICTRLLPIPQITRSMAQMKFDGAIVYLEQGYLQELAGMGIPIVDVSNWLPEQHFPSVLVDDRAVGRLAAEYFMELGLRHFGVVGVGVGEFSALRSNSFRQRIAHAGLMAEEMSGSPASKSPVGFEVPVGVGAPLAAWLVNLPKPVGIFGTFEGAASDAVEACRQLGIKVPEEVCVLGVDNDELTSKFTHPPLSSIALPAEKIGFDAANLLDRLMAGEPAPTKPICLPPVGVVARQSTNLLAIPDEDVQAAVRYIREHVHTGVTVADLLKVVPLNRRYLERKFKQYLGRTPLEEIHRTRLGRARELLAGTDLPMPKVADRSGFSSPERFSNVFHEQAGLTPTDYRRRFRTTEASMT